MAAGVDFSPFLLFLSFFPPFWVPVDISLSRQRRSKVNSFLLGLVSSPFRSPPLLLGDSFF